ncbi:MAG: FkbM family methyltransferase [Verrucomicrobia bacterium]|nr:FkbM family methyltransferase [Verrucomicrobiota bacterium]
MNVIVLFFVFNFFFASLHGWDVLQGAPPNKEVIRRIRSYLSDDPVIVEAGTYDAKDTLELRALLPRAKIFTFEPVPELFQKSAAKLASFPDIKIYNFALSDKVGFTDMYLSEFSHNPGVVTESSSLLVPTGHLIYASHVKFNHVIQVQTTTLDNWAKHYNVSNVDFLKLDIQGNELDVILSSPDILDSIKAILMEVEFKEAYKDQYLFEDIKIRLEALGFTLDCLFINCDWFGDALFIRK